MRRRPRSRARLSTVVAAAALVVTTGVSSAQADSGGAEPSPSGTPSGPLAGEMSRMLEVRPGGVQLSDNAMAWDDGDVVMVWPSPGESSAPAGLGPNVRDDVVGAMGLDAATVGDGAMGLDAAAAGDGASAGEMSAAGSWSTCPPGYYCFYTGTNYDGERLQFSDRCSGGAGAWGFSNVTSSWVNRDYGKVVYAYDYKGGSHLWTMNPGAMDSYVGSADNNRMSYFRCRYV